MNEPIEYTIEPSRQRWFKWRELWIYRELFYFFTWRDVKVRYKQTVLGVLWVVLQPILTVLVFSLFFGRALNVPSAGLPYPVFVFSGLLSWNFFSASVNAAGNSMVSQATIIKKIYFPRLIIPISSILVAGIDFLISFILFLGVMIYYQVPVTLQVFLWWPIGMVVMIIGTVGISCGLAALTVKYRDFRYVIPFGLQILLFVSPVIYPVTITKIKWISYALAMNPMYAVISFFRAPLIGFQDDVNLLILSGASSLILLIAGIFYFKRTEAFFADIA